MGQRANYIIKQNDNLSIHYHHWRANSIASDLYLGEERFLAFVKECRLDEVIINEPWIEGCVIIDMSSRHIYFWAEEFPRETSVIEYYMLQLENKWKGWKVEMLKNRMYDAEKILSIDYISKQELHEPRKWTKEDIVNDRIEDWETAVVLIKEHTDLFVTKTGNLDVESIVGYGSDIIPLIKDKQRFELPFEEDETTNECILIDLPEKKIIINESSFGLWEQSNVSWTGFKLIMGDFGYIETLRLSGIDTSTVEMPLVKVKEQFNELVARTDTFDPLKLAKELIEKEKDIQFHPDYFDNVEPKKTIFEKIRFGFRRVIGKR
jgi:hypothetical protein